MLDCWRMNQLNSLLRINIELSTLSADKSDCLIMRKIVYLMYCSAVNDALNNGCRCSKPGLQIYFLKKKTEFVTKQCCVTPGPLAYIPPLIDSRKPVRKSISLGMYSQNLCYFSLLAQFNLIFVEGHKSILNVSAKVVGSLLIAEVQRTKI